MKSNCIAKAPYVSADEKGCSTRRTRRSFQDSVIMERLLPDDANIRLTMEHLESFAKEGLRTLCLGYRTLSREEYNVS